MPELWTLFQSTHPRGVRPASAAGLFFVCHISIHAPTRGATEASLALTLGEAHFNPRTHEGCDLNLPKEVLEELISIHAPTRGAT